MHVRLGEGGRETCLSEATRSAPTLQDEVYTVAFSDQSFVGPLGKADLLRAIDMKVGAPAPKPPTALPVANGNP